MRCLRHQTPQETPGHTAARCSGNMVGSLKQEAAEGGPEARRLGDRQRASSQNTMGKCEERWHEGGRDEQAGVTLTNPSPTSSRGGGGEGAGFLLPLNSSLRGVR